MRPVTIALELLSREPQDVRSLAGVLQQLGWRRASASPALERLRLDGLADAEVIEATRLQYKATERGRREAARLRGEILAFYESGG